MDREDLNKKIMERFKKEASDFLKSKNPEEETKEEMIHKFDFVTSEDSSDESKIPEKKIKKCESGGFYNF